MKYILIVISYLPLLQILSGFFKVLKTKSVMDNLAKFQTGSLINNNLRLTGIAEMVCVILFFIPATMHIGFFLLCSWLGGATMIHLISNDKPIPLVVLVLVWVSAYIRDPSLFGFH